MSTSDVTTEDLAAVAAASRALGIAPRDVLVMLFFESAGFNPKADNQGCVGLNQFCQSSGTFKGAVRDLTPEQYKQLSSAEQLTRYIVPWWLSELKNRPVQSARDLEWLNFEPNAYIPHAPDSFVVSSDPLVVSQNAPFVFDGKPFITAGDIGRRLGLASKTARFQELGARLDALSGGAPPTPFPTPSGTAAETVALLGGAFLLWRLAA
jgi:hypothetical protein